MSHLNKNKTGLTLGVFYLICHAVWGILVGIKAAQPLLDWVLSLHFLSVEYTLNAFQPLQAFLLMAVAFVSGYVMGWIFAALWNTANQ